MVAASAAILGVVVDSATQIASKAYPFANVLLRGLLLPLNLSINVLLRGLLLALNLAIPREGEALALSRITR